jgi:CMP-N-acetylneuraminic acid synthetase
MKHIAVIPAREGSVGLPHKNRMFFDRTADFIDTLSWLDEVIVSTDDSQIKKKTIARKYSVHHRPEQLAGSDVSIKSVFEDIGNSLQWGSEDIIWLFYLTILYHNRSHFETARNLIERKQSRSLCSFIMAPTHPFNTWRFDEERKALEQYIPNDVFRRQDLPPAWEHYHYVCCLKGNEISNVNQELINSKTIPLFLDDQTASNLIEVDTQEELDRWKQKMTGDKI